MQLSSINQMSQMLPENKKNKSFLMLGITVLGAVLATGAITYSLSQGNETKPSANINKNINTSSSVNKVVNASTPGVTTENKEGFLSSLNNKINGLRSTSDFELHPINPTDFTVKYGAFTDIQKAGNFKLSAGLSHSEIAKKVALIKYDSSEYFLSLVSFAEGFRDKPYADAGTGFAIGNGYNMSVQSSYMNEQMFSMITKDAKTIALVRSLSGKTNQASVDQSSLSQLSVSPQQAAQIAQALKYEFSQPLANIIGGKAILNNGAARKYVSDHRITPKEFGQLVLDNLAPNERDTIVYHAYKVGTGGFQKYNGLINSLVDYHFNKTPKLAETVASHFTYNYKAADGSIKQDTSASGKLAAMFLDKEGFAYLIGKSKTYPYNFKTRLASVQPKSVAKDGQADSLALTTELEDYIQNELKAGRTPNLKLEGANANVSHAPTDRLTAYRNAFLTRQAQAHKNLR